MAVSRPLLFVLLGVLVLFAAVTAMRMAGSAEDAEPSKPAASASATSAVPAPAAPTGASTKPPKAVAAAKRQRGGAKRSRGAARPSEGIPKRVARALGERKVVVLFFGARGGDGRVTRQSARAVRGGDVAVFTDTVYHLDDYARLVGALPISQIPATVVIDRDRQARVVQGFADAGTLRQLVVDAR